MKSTRWKPSPAVVVAVVALVAALGGTAVGGGAFNGQEKKQIKKIAKKLDKKIALTEGPPGEQGPRGPAGSPDTPQQVLDKLKQVDGTGSGLDADSVAGIAASELGTVGRSAEGVNCLDDNQTGTACASVNLTLPRTGRVLVISDGFAVASQLDDTSPPGSGTDDTARVQGTCTLYADNVSLVRSSSQSLFHANETDGVAITTVTAPMAAGTHSFALRCVEEDGDIDWGRSRITAVMLGNG